VISTIEVGTAPFGVAITPDGSKVYVAVRGSGPGFAAVIDTATNTVTATPSVGLGPLGLSIGVPAVQDVPLSANRCDGVFEGNYTGNLTIADGQDCTFINGKINGSVTMTEGNLVLLNTTVDFAVSITGGTYNLSLGTTVKGEVTIQYVASKYPNGSICGTTLSGGLLVENNAAGIQIGSASSSVCPPNSVLGLTVTNNTGSVFIFDNTTTGSSLFVSGNTGPLDVVGNVVKGSGATLTCQNNSALIMSNGNKAKTKQGQCS
jgi:YVTN family beta-propeller protein